MYSVANMCDILDIHIIPYLFPFVNNKKSRQGSAPGFGQNAY